jgi:hypothetical protein
MTIGSEIPSIFFINKYEFSMYIAWSLLFVKTSDCDASSDKDVESDAGLDGSSICVQFQDQIVFDVDPRDFIAF